MTVGAPLPPMFRPRCGKRGRRAVARIQGMKRRKSAEGDVLYDTDTGNGLDSVLKRLFIDQPIIAIDIFGQLVPPVVVIHTECGSLRLILQDDKSMHLQEHSIPRKSKAEIPIPQ